MSENFIYGNGTNRLYGVSDSIDLDSSITVASSKAIKTTYDKVLVTEAKADEALTKTGLPLGHIYLWPFPTPPHGSIQLNGSTYNRQLYSDFFNYITENNLVKTEFEWQTIASANNGYCPWYSDGDGSTTFRTPKFAPYQKIALASGDVGKYYEAGLPNITGDYTKTETYRGYYNGNFSGAFVGKPDIYNSNLSGGTGSNLEPSGWIFDASLSNPIYGNSTTVQPESHDWIVCVVAYGRATNTGEVDVSNVMSAIDQIQAEVTTKLNNNTVHIVETWKSDDGTSWYRKWSDGWIEQGGVYYRGSSVIGVNTVTFNTPFSNTLYSFYAYYLLGSDEGRDYIGANNYISRLTTATSFYIPGGFAGYNWYACGY